MPHQNKLYLSIHLEAELKTICNHTYNPNLVLSAMKDAIESSMWMVRKKCVVEFLTLLSEASISTNDIEYRLRRFTRWINRNDMLIMKKRIMKKKINDAYRQLSIFRKQSIDIWKRSKTFIPANIRGLYITVWKRQKDEFRNAEKEKYTQRFDWLKQKWKADNVVPDSIRDISVCDLPLRAEFTSVPRTYGGVVFSEEEMQVLKLPPGFALLPDIRVSSCVIDAETALNKLRWKRNFNVVQIKEEVYNVDTQTIDMRNIKTSELPFNAKVYMPKAVGKEEEIRFERFKEDVKDIAQDVIKDHKREGNVNSSVKTGLQSLKNKVRDNSIILFKTDKSGRWAGDTPLNYQEACNKHLRNNEEVSEITEKQHEDAEREMNSHAMALCRMMGLKDDDHGNTIRQQVTSEGNVVAPFYCLRKDHKTVEVGEEERGPKTRPVCGAKDCHTKRTSYLLCKVLKELIPTEETHCDSTEDLLAELEMANKEDVKESWVVGSLDVEALYPSLDIPRCSKVVSEKLMESPITIKGIEWKEVALYLKYHLTDEELHTTNIARFIPTRKFRHGRPLFVRSGSIINKTVRLKPWIFTEELPEELAVREMFCLAIKVMVRKTMELHDFIFNNIIYRQKHGGSIGLDLTGMVANIYMCYWDNELKCRLMEANIHAIVYKRYVDDVDVILDDRSRGIKNEEATMIIVQNIANEIDPCIKTTIDYGSQHNDNKLPVLDLKIWIGKNAAGEAKIIYTHYIKDVSTRAVIHANSAHPENVKLNVLVNEAGRILRNCSIDLKWEIVVSHLEYFSQRMQYSGYNKEQRYNVIKKALSKHDQRMENMIDGRRYRRRKDVYTTRRKEKKKKHEKWFTNGGRYETVMFVEPTKGSQLKKRIQIAAKKNKIKLKVIEKTGTKIQNLLQRSDPFSNGRCQRNDCAICRNELGVNCRARGCVYEVVCAECKNLKKKEKYRGQTGRSMYHRTKQHFEDWNKKDGSSPLWRHSKEYHQNNNYPIELKILSKCFGKPTKRMITESVMIDEMEPEETMNSKNERGYVKV